MPLFPHLQKITPYDSRNQSNSYKRTRNTIRKHPQICVWVQTRINFKIESQMRKRNDRKVLLRIRNNRRSKNWHSSHQPFGNTVFELMRVGADSMVWNIWEKWKNRIRWADLVFGKLALFRTQSDFSQNSSESWKLKQLYWPWINWAEDCWWRKKKAFYCKSVGKISKKQFIKRAGPSIHCYFVKQFQGCRQRHCIKGRLRNGINQKSLLRLWNQLGIL